MKIVRTLCIKLYELVNNCISPSDDAMQARLIELEERSPNREYPGNIEPDTPGSTRSHKLKVKLNELGTSVIKFGAKNKNKRVSDRSLDVLFNYNLKPANTIVDMRNSKPFNKKEERVITEHLKVEKKRSWSTDNVEMGFNSNVDITGAMSEWNEKHYIFFKHHFEYSYLSQTMKMKLTRNIFLSLANKKLEKFHSSLSTERVSERKSRRPENNQSIEIKDEFQKSLKGEYINDEIGLKCLYRRKKKSKKNKEKSEKDTDIESYEKLISFTCNASDPLLILKWFNSEKTWESLYNIVNMRLVENERYSVIQAEQFNSGLVNKRFYTIVRQIEVTKFDNLPGKHFIIQTDISFGKDETFHNILKFEISKCAKVEIFSQTAEKTKGDHHTVFMEQWKSFEESLIRHNIPKKDRDFMEIEENIIGEEDHEN